VSKIKSARGGRRNIRIYKFFLADSSINLCINSSLLFVFPSNVQLSIDLTSLRESDGSNRTSGVTSALRMMIGTTSLKMIPCRVM
jgi:hypothetical protein